MRLRSLVLALLLASGVASAATKHPKPPKVAKHAQVKKGVKRQSRKAAKHPASPKMAKRKTAKFKTAKVKKHKA